MTHSPKSLSRDLAGHINDLVNLADEGAIRACDVFTWNPLPPATGGLLGDHLPNPITLRAIVDPEAEKQGRLAALLAKVHGHPGYLRLKASDGFQRIMRSRLEFAQNNVKFDGPVGEIRLIREVALFVGIERSPNHKRRRATREHKRRVKKAARVLHDLLMPGAQPSDWQDSRELRRLLLSLHEQMSTEIQKATSAGTRERYSDKDAAQRGWLVSFAMTLFVYFDEAPAPIVHEVATMLGFEPDDRTVQRYISRAESAWKRCVTDAGRRTSDR